MIGLSLLAAGCASSTPGSKEVGNARIVVVYDEDVLLTGATDGQSVPAAAACAPSEPKHVVELPEPSKAKVTLRATDGAGELQGATLRVTSIATKQTWCATMKGDHTTIATKDQLPSGLYAVSVVEQRPQPHRYEILWEQAN
jgi:hypothetical protein